MPETTEATLIEQVLKGRRECFRPLVEQYQRRVYHLANSMLDNGPEAQDIAQEAFLTAYQKLRELDDPAKFGSWLYGITRNLCYNARRSRRIHTQPIDDTPPQALENVVSLRPAGPDDNADDLLNRLEAMPEKYRILLRLKYLDDYSYQEIARLTDLPVDLVRSRLFEGRRILKERMEETRREDHGR